MTQPKRRDPGPLPWEQPSAVREARRARRRRTLGRLGWTALVVVALASVVWRQTAGQDRFRELEGLREEIAVAEAERAELQNRILELSRRERIVRVAGERLGMHVARDEEVVLLPVAGAERPAGADETKDSASGGDR
ncbi:MAG TPA: hypothetical protein VHG91_16075 [Longimicrobium sp.]|nr:hypothetical protein [Longimicrobium sp.]